MFMNSLHYSAKASSILVFNRGTKEELTLLFLFQQDRIHQPVAVLKEVSRPSLPVIEIQVEFKLKKFWSDNR
jgi:hypothetical protein